MRNKKSELKESVSLIEWKTTRKRKTTWVYI